MAISRLALRKWRFTVQRCSDSVSSVYPFGDPSSSFRSTLKDRRAVYDSMESILRGFLEDANGRIDLTTLQCFQLNKLKEDDAMIVKALQKGTREFKVYAEYVFIWLACSCESNISMK